MPSALGQFLVSILLIVLGLFAMISAYSRKEILLQIASLSLIKIDPDHPGKRQRAILFGIGLVMCLIGVALIVVDKLHSIGLV